MGNSGSTGVESSLQGLGGDWEAHSKRNALWAMELEKMGEGNKTHDLPRLGVRPVLPNRPLRQ